MKILDFHKFTLRLLLLPFISEDEIKQTRVLGPLQVEEASLLRALAHPEAADVRAPVQGAENQVRGQVHARQEG